MLAVRFASWTLASSPPACQGLTGQGDRAPEGWLIFQRFSACRLL